MANAEKPEVTQAEIVHSRELWSGFTKLLKYGTIATILAVIMIALITL
jgi:hypothetical protein